jgi:hypothetical protein
VIVRLLFFILFCSFVQPSFGRDTLRAETKIDTTLASPIVSLTEHPMLVDFKHKEELSIHVRKAENRTIEFFVSVALLFILGLLRQIFPQYLSNLLGSIPFLGDNKRSQGGLLANDGKASLGFYALYLVNLVYILYTAFKLFTPFAHKPTSHLVVLSILSVIVLVGIKTLLSSLISWVFKQEDFARLYRFNNAKVNEFTGMILFPLSLLVLLTHGQGQRVLASLALLILCISVLFKYLRNRGVMNSLLRIDFFHFLMYLCAFEIVPVLVLVKWVVGH